MRFPFWSTKKPKRKLRNAAYPVHGRTLGYLDTAREPYTWFICNNGHTEMGNPWELPNRDCSRCALGEAVDTTEGWKQLDFTGWEVADTLRAHRATLNAVDTVDPTARARLYARTQEP
jgi:hypothetical protein